MYMYIINENKCWMDHLSAICTVEVKGPYILDTLKKDMQSLLMHNAHVK